MNLLMLSGLGLSIPWMVRRILREGFHCGGCRSAYSVTVSQYLAMSISPLYTKLFMGIGQVILD